MKITTLQGSYPYTYVRTVLMKKKLLRKEDYDKILKMSPEEIAKFIEELEYKEDIDALGVEYAGRELVERALQRNLARTFKKMLAIAPEDLQMLLKLYQRRYDIYNIKAIVRGQFSKLAEQEILQQQSPIMVENKEFFDKLRSLQTIEEKMLAIPFLRRKQPHLF
jgi:V/A-type H+/Na+-transporting ATPase subunit C